LLQAKTSPVSERAGRKAETPGQGRNPITTPPRAPLDPAQGRARSWGTSRHAALAYCRLNRACCCNAKTMMNEYLQPGPSRKRMLPISVYVRSIQYSDSNKTVNIKISLYLIEVKRYFSATQTDLTVNIQPHYKATRSLLQMGRGFHLPQLWQYSTEENIWFD